MKVINGKFPNIHFDNKAFFDGDGSVRDPEPMVHIGEKVSFT